MRYSWDGGMFVDILEVILSSAGFSWWSFSDFFNGVMAKSSLSDVADEGYPRHQT
jgi:hypothetical protein